MKAKLQIEEKVSFDHYIEVEVENEETLEKAYERIESRYEDLYDVAMDLQKVEGMKIVDVCQDDSGSQNEIEIYGWYDQRD